MTVYALCDTSNECIGYIGISIDTEYRWFQHRRNLEIIPYSLNQCVMASSRNWLRFCLAHGYDVEMVELPSISTSMGSNNLSSFEQETLMVAGLTNAGIKLANIAKVPHSSKKIEYCFYPNCPMCGYGDSSVNFNSGQSKSRNPKQMSFLD